MHVYMYLYTVCHTHSKHATHTQWEKEKEKLKMQLRDKHPSVFFKEKQVLNIEETNWGWDVSGEGFQMFSWLHCGAGI